MDTMMKTSNDLTSLGQDHGNAFMKAGQIWLTGCHAIGQTIVANSQANMEHMMSGWKAMSTAKSFKDAADMQKTLMRSSVENVMSSTSTITGATMTLIEQSMAPITASMSTVAERFTVARI